MLQTKQISILGCGWLGLPLAKHFITNGYKIKGSSTSIEKKSTLLQEGITPFIFTLGKNASQAILSDFFSGSEIIVINFPPKRTPDIITIYKQQLLEVLPFISKTQKVIFISSTSVYQNTNNWVTEALELKPEKASGKAIVIAEQLLKHQLKQNLTILRFSGLIGPNRHPGNFFRKKTGIINGESPVNIIHQDDCIRLIDTVITQNCWGEIFNGTADEHPTKQEFYSLAAKKIGLQPPLFNNTSDLKFKKVCNLKSKHILNFTYKYSNPLKMIN